MTRTAVLAGASGAVGSEVLLALLNDPDWGRVHSLVRRPRGTADPKLTKHVADFDDLDAQVARQMVEVAKAQRPGVHIHYSHT